MTKNYQIDMTTGPLFGKMLRFALPLMLSGVLQLLFNAADIIVVGRFCGDNSMAAVGSNGSMVNLLTNFFIGLSVGVNVLAARYYGAKNDEELQMTVHTSVLLSIVGGIGITFIGLFFAPKLLILMSTPAGIIDLSTLYLRIYFLGMTATTVYNFGSALLRAIGDTRRPLYYLAFAGVLNVILNVIFVVALHMDVAGVALATVISQTVSASLVIRCLIHESGAIRLYPKKLRFHKKTLFQIVRTGLPAGLQASLFSLSNTVIQSSINLFGETVVSGNTAASNLEGFVYVAMTSFYQATISFTSQNYGKRLYKRIVRILGIGMICSIVTGQVLGGGLMLFGKQLLWIYSDTQEVVEAGLIRFGFIAAIYGLCGIMDCFVGSLRGIGYSLLPMIISLIGACGMRLLWLSTVFQIPKYHVIETVYLSYPLSWALTALMEGICLWILLKKIKKNSPTELESTPKGE